MFLRATTHRHHQGVRVLILVEVHCRSIPAWATKSWRRSTTFCLSCVASVCSRSIFAEAGSSVQGGECITEKSKNKHVLVCTTRVDKLTCSRTWNVNVPKHVFRQHKTGKRFRGQCVVNIIMSTSQTGLKGGTLLRGSRMASDGELLIQISVTNHQWAPGAPPWKKTKYSRERRLTPQRASTSPLKTSTHCAQDVGRSRNTTVEFTCLPKTVVVFTSEN